jgi:hypothetical protein
MASTFKLSPSLVPVTLAVMVVLGGVLGLVDLSARLFKASMAFALPASSNLKVFPEATKANVVVEPVASQVVAAFCWSAAQLASTSLPVQLSANASVVKTATTEHIVKILRIFFPFAEFELSKGTWGVLLQSGVQVMTSGGLAARDVGNRGNGRERTSRSE